MPQPQKILDLSRDHLRQHEAILNTGPGEDSLWLAVLDSVARAVKLVVEQALIAQNSLTNKQGGNRLAVEALKEGPGLPTLLVEEALDIQKSLSIDADFSRRREKLSWSHHAEVAAMPVAA